MKEETKHMEQQEQLNTQSPVDKATVNKVNRDKVLQKWAFVFQKTLEAIMAPQGYKNGHSGMRVVAGLQFYAKERIDRAVVQALTNFVSFRNEVQKTFDAVALNKQIQIDNNNKLLKTLPFFRWGWKRNLRLVNSQLETELDLLADLLTKVNKIEPNTEAPTE